MKFTGLLFFTLMLIILILPASARAQGCSDAGLCTVNGLKPADYTREEQQFKNRFKIGLSGGQADYSINIISSYLEYNRGLGENFNADIRLTFLSQSGPSVTSSGFSDVFLNVSYSGVENATITTGMKFPLSRGDKEKDGLPLPMDYQSSLGTVDMVLGMALTFGAFEFVIGLQQPLIQNSNSFLASFYPPPSQFGAFQSTRDFIRKGDILFRMLYPIRINEKWTVTPGILPIYHYADDEFTDAAGLQQKIHGSQGLTINANLFLIYSIASTDFLELVVGRPLKARTVRPDGLTRAFVATAEYRRIF